MNEEIDKYAGEIKQLVIAHGLAILMAILVLFVGLRIIKVVTKGINKAMIKRNVDDSLRPFLISMLNILLKVMLFISVIQMIGIETTSFVAVLASAGLALGLALSGTLQNFAGGVIILLFKPFKKGDFIEAQSYTGTVFAIQIFATILKTVDNKTVFIPNGPLSSGSLINYTAEDTRRVDMTFGVSYSAPLDKVRNILQKLLDEDPRVMKESANLIAVASLGDNSVNFTVRVWVQSPDYWPLFFDFQEKVKIAFDQEGISIPFPQMDVHLSKAED